MHSSTERSSLNIRKRPVDSDRAVQLLFRRSAFTPMGVKVDETESRENGNW